MEALDGLTEIRTDLQPTPIAVNLIHGVVARIARYSGPAWDA
jgi:hypothetical protein